MTTDTVPQTVLFPDLFDKPLFAKFNQEQASSDGGAVLLKAAERVYGLVKAFARCLSDIHREIRQTREPGEQVRRKRAELVLGQDNVSHRRQAVEVARLQRRDALSLQNHQRHRRQVRVGHRRAVADGGEAIQDFVLHLLRAVADAGRLGLRRRRQGECAEEGEPRYGGQHPGRAHQPAPSAGEARETRRPAGGGLCLVRRTAAPPVRAAVRRRWRAALLL